MMMRSLGRSRSLPPKPGALFFWLHGQDANLLRNAGLTDGGTQLTWKNKGNLGAAGNATQATSGLRAVYRYLAAAGKINNRSALESDGTKQMQTGTFTSVPVPITWAAVVRQTGVGNKVVFSGPSGAAHQLGTNILPISSFSGAVVVTGQSIVANTWHTLGYVGNGGTSTANLDGSTTGAFSGGSLGVTGVSVFGDGVGGELMQGMIADVLGWSGPLSGHATLAEITAYVAREYGPTPQA